MKPHALTIEVLTRIELEVVARCTVESDGEVIIERVEPDVANPRKKPLPDIGDWLDTATLQTIESEAAMKAAEQRKDEDAARVDDELDAARDRKLDFPWGVTA